MDLNTVQHVLRPGRRDRIPAPCAGDAFLGGGTWLFSEPQRHLNRLIDLAALEWPALERREDAMFIAATCTLAELNDASPAGALMEQCRRALWGSFKIWNAATIGGNLCLALPAAPMAALAVALDATCEIWCPDGSNRQVDAQDFILDAQKTCLAPGEILRGLHVPAHALAARYAFRQASLTEEGRSATLVIGRNDAPGLALTITAATRRPLHIRFAIVPDASTLHHAIEKEVAAHGGWFDDKHGAPDWRRHMTLRLAAEITLELAAS